MRLSNWEAETLDAQQTEYAANDALVATDIFRYEGVLLLTAIDSIIMTFIRCVDGDGYPSDTHLHL